MMATSRIYTTPPVVAERRLGPVTVLERSWSGSGRHSAIGSMYEWKGWTLLSENGLRNSLEGLGFTLHEMFDYPLRDSPFVAKKDGYEFEVRLENDGTLSVRQAALVFGNGIGEETTEKQCCAIFTEIKDMLTDRNSKALNAALGKVKRLVESSLEAESQA